VLFASIIEVLDPELHSAALNMALDEALLQHAAFPTLRIYGWRERAVSLGYFSRFAEAQRAAAGREMVRRWTGGGLVEHGGDLTYTLIVPRAAAFFQYPPLESYRLIHGQIAQWLMGRGIAACVAPSASAEKSGACFASHVRYDVVAGVIKLAGAAQRRTRWGLLHQGSIQLPLAGVDLAKAFATGIRQTSLAPDILQAAHLIAQQKYATEDWLRKF
jgi:lipoate-protein ligase A